jgi:hypothetical protein
MVLSEQDKKIILDRLKAGREKKKAEREAAAKKQKTQEAKGEAVVPVEQPVTAPAAAQETAPVVAEQPPPEPPRIDPSKARKPAKQVEPSSDSDSEVEQEENKKKSSKMKNKKKKNVPYMKIKIYQEPKNHEALNALIGAVQQEEQAPPVEMPPTPAAPQRVTTVTPKQKLTAPIVRQNTMRSMAMDIFG